MKLPSWPELRDFFQRLYTKILDTDVLGNSAQVAFYFSFAMFPFLLFLVSLFGIILVSAADLQGELFNYLGQIMPGSAFDLVKTTLEEVVKGSSGGKLTLGLLVTLWSASAGIDSLRQALNEVYQLKEGRPWWKTKLYSLIMTFLFVMLLTVALGAVFYGEQLLTPVMNSVGLGGVASTAATIVKWTAFLIVLIITTAVIYSGLPSFPNFKWAWISPGAVVAIILFILLTGVFRVYLQYFNSYNKTYGSLGAVIILMLWLYLTAVSLLLGGAINSVLNKLATPTKNVAEGS